MGHAEIRDGYDAMRVYRGGALKVPETASAAVLAVLNLAHDADDAAELLAMLGLLRPSNGPGQDQDCLTRQTLAGIRTRRAAALSAAKAAAAETGRSDG